jgi:hypothetical protein
MDPGIHIKVGLEEHTTIFQAELLAFGSDSQAALKSLISNKINSKTAYNCLRNIIKLGQNNNLKLIWVPRHSGIPGMVQWILIKLESKCHQL